MKYSFLSIFIFYTGLLFAQNLPPKKAYPFNIKQIHSGHSLTDPLFYHWPGQFVNLVAHVNSLQAWQLFDVMVGKSTGPGSSLSWRWNNPMTGSPDARLNIKDWALLSITERVPMAYQGGNTQQWYIDLIQEQKQYLSLFVNNAWNNGNNGKGTPTLLWTTWTNIDNSNGPWRQMLDIQGAEFERMQDYANVNRPTGAPPVYIIPGHKMMAKLYDDIQLKIVPGITNINQFFSDNIHPNEIGAYAICMIHYACIFNKNPEGLPNNLVQNAPSGTPIPSPELALYLQKMIWKVVTTYPRTGITDSATSITENSESNNEIEIFPNPVTDFLYLNTMDINDNEQNYLYNSFGKLVYIGTENKINLSHLPTGTYILKSGKKFVKVMKE